MKKIIKYVLLDILRNKVVVAYTAFLLLISFSVFNLEDNSAKGILSLVNLVLIIIPLVSIVFSTIYVYNASEFIELLIAQPLKRSSFTSTCRRVVSLLRGGGATRIKVSSISFTPKLLIA